MGNLFGVLTTGRARNVTKIKISDFDPTLDSSKFIVDCYHLLSSEEMPLGTETALVKKAMLQDIALWRGPKAMYRRCVYRTGW